MWESRLYVFKLIWACAVPSCCTSWYEFLSEAIPHTIHSTCCNWQPTILKLCMVARKLSMCPHHSKFQNVENTTLGHCRPFLLHLCIWSNVPSHPHTIHSTCSHRQPFILELGRNIHHINAHVPSPVHSSRMYSRLLWPLLHPSTQLLGVDEPMHSAHHRDRTASSTPSCPRCSIVAKCILD